MLELTLPTMTCKHCVRAVTEAVQATDPAAQIEVDLARHHVRVDSAASRDAIVAGLIEAGYPPA